ncbi:MAG: cobyrinate a,c-diamide synthase, partial [Chloroflexi bacterium]
PPDLPPAYLLQPRTGGPPTPEGASLGSLWASYVHLHFWGKPELAARFVQTAA